VWSQINKKLGFYTYKTRHKIPTASGIYGWFVPLWLWDKYKDGKSYIEAIAKIFLYEPKADKDTSNFLQNIVFNWEKINISPDKERNYKDSESLENNWDKMKSNDKMKKAFEKALMEASLFLPPIYIGKSVNLRDRYESHIKGSNDKNDFHYRFEEYAEEHDIDLKVSELIFVCIQTPKVLNEFGDEEKNNLHELLEQVVMRISGPAFSIK